MTDPIQILINTKDLDTEGKKKEFTVPRKFQFTEESLLKTIAKVEKDLAELERMKEEFNK